MQSAVFSAWFGRFDFPTDQAVFLDRECSMYRHNKLYDKKRWKRRAKLQLTLEPLCARCLRHGVVMPATIADHIEPHRGDQTKFWEGKLQSLCASCHSGDKAQVERLGFSCAIGPDGWPVDGKHPVYR
jgi:5-methylcytosine-specific restriction endonuclease McrA